MGRALSPPASPYHRPAVTSTGIFPRIPHRNFQAPTVLRAVGILLLGLIIGVAGMMVYLYVQGATSTVPDRPQPDARPVKSVVIAQGTLEPRNGPVLVGSALVGYKILKVGVKEGDQVAEGQSIVELDPAAAEEELRIAQAQQNDGTQRQASELELAEQKLEAAELAVKQATDARDLEMDAARQRISAAELKVKQADSELKRMKTLASGADPLVSTQQLDQQEVLKELAVADRDAAKVALKRLEQSLDFQLQKARSEQKAAASGVEIAKRASGLEALQGQVALAKIKLDHTKVTTPLAGTVINVGVHPGEVVSTQPLVQIADLTDMVCVAEVDVSDVPLLKEGAQATITSRAFHSQEIKGTIERIGNVAGSASLRPLDPRQSVDRTVTNVTLRIDARDAMKALGGDQKNIGAALVGLQVDVRFDVASPSE